MIAVFDIIHLLMSSTLQFREAVKDCDLPDSDDTYLLRWLIGILSLYVSNNDQVKRIRSVTFDLF